MNIFYKQTCYEDLIHLYKNSTVSVAVPQCLHGAFLVFVWLWEALSVILETLKHAKMSNLVVYLFLIFQPPSEVELLLLFIKHFIKVTSKKRDPIHYVW